MYLRKKERKKEGGWRENDKKKNVMKMWITCYQNPEWRIEYLL